jgi:hypothetical protein
MQGVSKKELYNDIPNVTAWRVLRKRLLLKAHKLSIVQGVYVSDTLVRNVGGILKN